MNEKLNENMCENSEQDTNQTLGKDRIMTLPDNIKNTIVSQLANNLMNNDSLMSSIAELRKMRQNVAPAAQENLLPSSSIDKLANIAKLFSDNKQENTDLTSLNHKLDILTNEILGLRKELESVKKQNRILKKLVKKIVNNNSENKEE